MVRKREKRRTERRFGFAHIILCVLLLGAVTLSVYLIASNAILKEESDSASRSVLSNIAAQVDSLLTSADYAVLSWAVNTSEIDDFFESKTNRDIDVVTKYEIKRELAEAIIEIKAIYSSVYSINLVNTSTMQVLSEAGIVTVSDFQETLSGAVFCYMPSSPFTSGDALFEEIERDLPPDGAEYIAIIRKYPISGGTSRGYIVTLIKVTDIAKAYDDYLSSGEERACIKIFDQGDRPVHVLYSAGAQEESASAHAVTRTYELVSQNTGWTFLYEKESGPFSLATNTMQRISILCMVLLVALILFIYVVGQMHFFRDIAQLVRSIIKDSEGTELHVRHNPIKTLEGVFNLVTDRTDRLQRNIDNCRPYVLSALLTARCSNGSPAQPGLSEKLDGLGVEDMKEVCCAAVLPSLRREETRALLSQMRSAPEAGAQEGFSCVQIPLAEREMLLLVFSSHDLKRNALLLERFVRQLRGIAAQKEMELTLFRTEVCHTINDLAAALEGYWRQRDYLVFAPENGQQAPGLPEEGGASAFWGKEIERIAQALRKQNLEELAQVTQAFFQRCAQETLNPYFAYLLWNELISKSVTVCLELGVPVPVLQEHNPYDLSRNACTMPELCQALLAFYQTVLDKKQQRKERSYTEDIIRYIDENFASSDISLAAIGQQFGISDSYVSLIIKEKIGISFVDYLARCRISRAQELLLSSDLPIADIGRQTGYPNVHSFIRAFKRLTGTSPGKWKATHGA